MSRPEVQPPFLRVGIGPEERGQREQGHTQIQAGKKVPCLDIENVTWFLLDRAYWCYLAILKGGVL